MNPAAVAGAPLGTGNVVFVPIQDPAAAPIHFGDQFLVVSEGLHCHLVSFIVTIIAVVINMFRLLDFLAGEDIIRNSLKLFST
jgi:hypothetical protein